MINSNPGIDINSDLILQAFKSKYGGGIPPKDKTAENIFLDNEFVSQYIKCLGGIDLAIDDVVNMFDVAMYSLNAVPKKSDAGLYVNILGALLTGFMTTAPTLLKAYKEKDYTSISYIDQASSTLMLINPLTLVLGAALKYNTTGCAATAGALGSTLVVIGNALKYSKFIETTTKNNRYIDENTTADELEFFGSTNFNCSAPSRNLCLSGIGQILMIIANTANVFSGDMAENQNDWEWDNWKNILAFIGVVSIFSSALLSMSECCKEPEELIPTPGEFTITDDDKTAYQQLLKEEDNDMSELNKKIGWNYKVASFSVSKLENSISYTIGNTL
jgi:hypothetical protein